MPTPPARARVHPRSGVPFTELQAAARERRRALEPVRAIALALDVTVPCVCNWVRDMPEHSRAKELNTASCYVGRRVYPQGTEAYAAKLRGAGFTLEQRLRLCRDAVAADARGRP